MPTSHKPGPTCLTSTPSFDPGTLNLQQSPQPGPISASSSTNPTIPAEDAPISGSIPVSLAAGALLRIPVPGTNGLAVELTARGFIPKGGVSTHFLFIQDITGKRHLNLDFSFNKNSQLIEWHWNQKGTNKLFGITDHTSAGPAEQALGEFAKYYKYAGRVFLIGGAALDAYSIVTSSRPLRRSVQVVSGWSAAAAGCRAVGAGGAAWGTAIEPGLGTAVGGFIGCALGTFIGYRAAEVATGYLYDWAEDTVFSTLAPEPDLKPGGGSSGGGGATGTW